MASFQLIAHVATVTVFSVIAGAAFEGDDPWNMGEVMAHATEMRPVEVFTPEPAVVPLRAVEAIGHVQDGRVAAIHLVFEVKGHVALSTLSLRQDGVLATEITPLRDDDGSLADGHADHGDRFRVDMRLEQGLRAGVMDHISLHTPQASLAWEVLAPEFNDVWVPLNLNLA